MADVIKINRECPHCGEHEGIMKLKTDDAGRHYVLCITCGARGGKGYTAEEAVGNWDRRFP